MRLFVCPSKFCISIVFVFSWEEKRATRNNAYAKFGGTNKEYYQIMVILLLRVEVDRMEILMECFSSFHEAFSLNIKLVSPLESLESYQRGLKP